VPGLSSGTEDINAKPSSAGGISVQVVNPLEIPNWDARVSELPSATFFHSSAWASVLLGAYGYNPLYLIVQDSERLHAALPIMEVKSWLTGNRGISLPFTDECGAIGTEIGPVEALFGTLQALSRTKNWAYFECRGGAGLDPGGRSAALFVGHRLDLRPGPDVLFSGVSSATQRAIRKSEQSGLSVEFSRDLDTVHAFHDLLCKTRKRHGVPPQPFSFFEQIHRHILESGKGWIAVARLGTTPVAGAVFFHFGSTAVYKYGASDDAYQHLRANNLVMWHSIQRLSRDGFQVLDFGRTSSGNEGLRRFKLGWGSTERPIDYLRYDCRKESYVAIHDQASGWHNKVFRLLPGPVSRLIGTVLYKHAA
jgi:GNAT acetyltransferase-like protein